MFSANQELCDEKQRLKRQARRRRKQESTKTLQGQKQKAFARWLECEVALPVYKDKFAAQGYVIFLL